MDSTYDLVDLRLELVQEGGMGVTGGHVEYSEDTRLEKHNLAEVAVSVVLVADADGVQESGNGNGTGGCSSISG